MRLKRSVAFFDEASAVGGEELVEVDNLAGEFAAFVGVAHAHTVGLMLADDGVRDDVEAFFDGLDLRLEGLVLDELETARMVDERIPGDACPGLIGFREAAVDN